MIRSTLAVLLLLLGGCRHRDPEGTPAPADAPKEDVTLLVRNHHWLDINIYMMHGNVRQRLGTVTGASEKSFTIPWARLTGQSGLQLIADPVGQSGVLTEEVNAVRPGSVVEWTIESALRQSSIAVF
ncbi:MAG TPA: hypothetical protein VGP80_07625 [Gemmatimonadales bacterium]|jgi:hypothetical protein|nr:hypothetical protein [Gemmatimonadales bacterium]